MRQERRHVRHETPEHGDGHPNRLRLTARTCGTPQGLEWHPPGPHPSEAARTGVDSLAYQIIAKLKIAFAEVEYDPGWEDGNGLARRNADRTSIERYVHVGRWTSIVKLRAPIREVSGDARIHGRETAAA